MHASAVGEVGDLEAVGEVILATCMHLASGGSW